MFINYFWLNWSSHTFSFMYIFTMRGPSKDRSWCTAVQLVAPLFVEAATVL